MNEWIDRLAKMSTKKLVIIGCLIALALYLLSVIFPTPRYTIHSIGEGRAYQHDRLLGKVYILAGVKRIEVVDE